MPHTQAYYLALENVQTQTLLSGRIDMHFANKGAAWFALTVVLAIPYMLTVMVLKVSQWRKVRREARDLGQS